MPTIALEPKITKTDGGKQKSNPEKAAPASEEGLGFRYQKYLGIIRTREGREVKAFSITDSQIRLIIFPLSPTGTLSPNYFLIQTTELRAAVRRKLGC